LLTRQFTDKVTAVSTGQVVSEVSCQQNNLSAKDPVTICQPSSVCSYQCCL